MKQQQEVKLKSVKKECNKRDYYGNEKFGVTLDKTQEQKKESTETLILPKGSSGL